MTDFFIHEYFVEDFASIIIFSLLSTVRLSSSRGMQIEPHPRPHKKISSAGQKLPCVFFGCKKDLGQFESI
jgi:hypothetical protein